MLFLAADNTASLKLVSLYLWRRCWIRVDAWISLWLVWTSSEEALRDGTKCQRPSGGVLPGPPQSCLVLSSHPSSQLRPPRSTLQGAADLCPRINCHLCGTPSMDLLGSEPEILPILSSQMTFCLTLECNPSWLAWNLLWPSCLELSTPTLDAMLTYLSLESQFSNGIVVCIPLNLESLPAHTHIN